jgi:hypothetical protein
MSPLTIRTWRAGILLLDADNDMRQCDLARELNIDKAEAKVLIDNYCYIKKIERKKREVTRHATDSQEYILNKKYRTAKSKV